MRTEIPPWVADEEKKISSRYPREVQSLRDALARRMNKVDRSILDRVTIVYYIPDCYGYTFHTSSRSYAKMERNAHVQNAKLLGLPPPCPPSAYVVVGLGYFSENIKIPF